ncbi:PAS domain-containing sensor histidine kinase [Natrarchaeobius halalkaliphilus]|uniref:histidine kinase n=1 Tax=Natrarchaeobius halalkaliphilus TaxID=1679091 RepID=A0A3N6NYV5_9EURY|nr:PAS domain-containing sensor histidine kinase [Natrarchaeobius halalkaliphilus]RQG86656.1 PAS domain-containing sensor histidine kinase [Natrarchaeobius halalkaliphilus]
MPSGFGGPPIVSSRPALDSRPVKRGSRPELDIEQITRTLPSPSAICDDSTAITSVNDEFCVAVERDPEELRGMSFDDLVAEPSLEALVEGPEATSEPLSNTIEYTTPSGTRRYASATARTIEAKSESGVYTLVILHDITDLKKRSERLAEFASVVSHDLRNPLQIATGHTQLLDDEYSHSSIDEIKRVLSQVETRVTDFLAIAQYGGSVREETAVSLTTSVRNAWTTATVPTESSVSLEVDSSLDGVSVMADRERLEVLFENLFRNAIEHGGDDVTVTVETHHEGVSVIDDGCGIEPSIRGSLFDVGETTASGNTGLGLHIVSEIVDAHGWQIDVTDGTDGGARFEITGLELSVVRDD